MDIFTRSATQDDLVILRDLEAEARPALETFRGGDRLAIEVPAVGGNWSRTLQDDSIFVFVSGVNSIVMGYLCARKSKKIATIEQVFVTRDARNLGIGDALISATLKWAKDNKLDSLDALALPGDRETKNLYERSGLVARLITVTKKLA